MKNVILPKLMRHNGTNREVIDFVYKQYFSETNMDNMEEVVDALGDLLGDQAVTKCIRETIDLHRKYTSSDVYSYVFSHAGRANGEHQASFLNNKPVRRLQ